jgi:DNA-binding MarR family transcriptional regulator
MKMSDALNVKLDRGTLKGVWNVLSYRAGDKGECWPSLERIALDTGLGKSTVCRALDELEQMGLIFRNSSEGGGSARTTVYTINCPRAGQLTVPERDTKERERKKEDAYRLSAEVRRDLDRAKMVRRRSEVKSTFEALCVMYPADVRITVPMICRETGHKPAKVRSDMLALMKNMDIDLDLAHDRFGKHKPRRARHAGRLTVVVPFTGRGRA